jgi:GTP-binding protein YchF
MRRCRSLARSPRPCAHAASLRCGAQSTLFNALVENGKAAAANFPFCTIEPNTGIVPVPDPRLQLLSDASGSLKLVPATVEFVDIAGLVKGASQGEGLGNKFLTHIRECDALVQVIRCFEDENIIHVSGGVNPVDDMETINLELALADAAQIEKRLERLGKGRSKTKEVAALEEVEAAALRRIAAALDGGAAARSVELSEEERAVVTPLYLLTAKPIIYAANVAEGDLADAGAANTHVAALRKAAAAEGASVVVVSAQVEAELNELDAAEKADYLEALGVPVEAGGLASLVRAAYTQLGLRTYFTSGVQETRAWTIRAGMTAPQAAGVIHSDFEKGFIRAETVGYDAMVTAGTMAAAKEQGLLRSEGKEYIVNEGDVMLFRFNV